MATWHKRASQPRLASISRPLARVTEAAAGRLNFGWRDTLGRWLEQAKIDSSDRSFQRFVLSADANFDRLFWEFYDMGLYWRREVAIGLYRAYGSAGTPDVRGDIGFSSRAILSELIDQLGIHARQANDRTDAAVASRLERQTFFAWMQVYPDQRSPDIVLETRADEAAWLFDAACVLGQYIKDRALYSGVAVLDPQLFPPDLRDRRDRLITPLLHQFAKGFFWLPLECPPTWTCSCNMVRALLNQRPAAHPEATGALTLRPPSQPSQPTPPAHAAHPMHPAPPPTPPRAPGLGRGIQPRDPRDLTPPGLPPITPITPMRSYERDDGDRRTPPSDPWDDEDR